MNLNSHAALAANAAANALGNQFGPANGEIGSRVNFDPGSGRATGGPYAQFQCFVSGKAEIIWMEDLGGVWVPMNGGLPVSDESSSGTSTAPTTTGEVAAAESYTSCSDTIASYHDMVNDLRTYLSSHNDSSALHDDFAALGDDLELMGQQADGKGRVSDGSTIQNAAAVYAADATEVETTGQLQDPPSDIAQILMASCPSSWQAAGLAKPAGSPGATETSPTTTGPATTPTATAGDATASQGRTCAVAGTQDLIVTGTSCSIAAEVVNAAETAPGCQVADQYGSPTSGACNPIEGISCTASLGTPPGAPAGGEQPPMYSCANNSGSETFRWYGQV